MTKTILITGASSGIGQAIAEHLAALGYRVFGTSRRPGAQPANFRLLPLDVQSTESVQACVQTVLAEAGRLDVLINNAGYVGPAAAVEETDLATVRAVFETNFFGVVQMTQAALPHLRAHGDGQIINISSMGGRIAYPSFFGAYTASKHALEGYTETLTNEVRALGVRVSLIEPGYFRTNIDQTLQAPDRPLAIYATQREHGARLDKFAIQHGRDPFLVARLVAQLIRHPRPRLRYPLGLDAWWLDWAVRWLPEPLFFALVEILVFHGPPLKATDDDATVYQKMGFRAQVIDAPYADALVRRMVTGFLAGGLAAAGVWAVMRLWRRKS